MRAKLSRRGLSVSLFCGPSAVALLIASPGFAQTTPTPTAGTAPPVDASASEVVVTGTRVVRNGFSAPTPTTVLGVAEISARAPSNLADLVNDLPQFTPSVTPATTIIGVGGGTGGGNFLNLRAMGVNRTLVLLDGARVVASTTGGGVDANLLPQGLVKRVDIVTGGASAAWGSDAVAGVVNFVLDRTFTGFKGVIQGGESGQGDVGNGKIDLTFGTPFADGRGHFLLEGGYTTTGGIDHYSDRSWYHGTKIVTNPAYVAGGSQPQLLQTNADLLLTAPGGVILSGAHAFNTAFDASGAPVAFDSGVHTSLYKIGGTPNDISADYQLLVPVRYGNVYTRASYELTPSITAYSEFAYAKSKTDNPSVTYPTFGTIAIKADNAYLPTALAGQAFVLGKTFSSLGAPHAENDRDVSRFVAGLDGKLGGTWRWNAYYQYGVSDITNAVSNDPIAARVALAVDGVNSGGQIVCRSSLTLSNGCQPFSPFGTARASNAALGYVTSRAVQQITLHESVASASIHGEPFSLPAGSVSFAGGVEYRTEQYGANADTLSLTNAYWVGNYKPGHGKYEVTEGFAEIVAPILKDVPLAKALDLDLAVRGTDYSLSGQVETYKVGLSWAVNDEVRFRATHSRDIRAPNLNDLFLGGQVNTVVLNDPQTGASGVNAVQIISGSTALQPEIAMTDSVGVVLRPHFLPGFSASVDYYRIYIEGGITTLNSQQIVNNCAAGQSGYCASVIRNSAGTITQVNVVPFNASAEKESGVDVEFDYTTRLDAFWQGMPGRITARSLGTNVLERAINALGGTTNLLGELSVANNGPPKWRWFNTLSYDVGPSSTQLTQRFISSGVIDNRYTLTPGVVNSINNNTIKSASLIDLSERWRFTWKGHSAEAFAVLENLFDTAPPASGAASFLYPGTNPSYYDTIGRQFKVGVRFSY